MCCASYKSEKMCLFNPHVPKIVSCFASDIWIFIRRAKKFDSPLGSIEKIWPPSIDAYNYEQMYVWSIVSSTLLYTALFGLE